MEELERLSRMIFHIYNQSNDRSSIFREHENYQFFLGKMIRQLKPVSHLLAYCLMPNHFHFLLIPKTDFRSGLNLEKVPLDVMPTTELSEAMKRLQMGYTKSFNKYFGLSGSRFRQDAKAILHSQGIRKGFWYIHNNPVKAKLVEKPSEWGYSSYNEYFGFTPPRECICDVELGRSLMKL